MISLLIVYVACFEYDRTDMQSNQELERAGVSYLDPEIIGQRVKDAENRLLDKR